MDVGDRVKLIKTHSSMNKKLKEYLHELGHVVLIGMGHNSNKVLVDFEKQDFNYGRWWVNKKHLEIIKGTI